MSNRLIERHKKQNVSERVLLRRLKKEAKWRNCSVVLHKARIPVHGYYNVSTGEGDCDQEVPNITDMEDKVSPAWLPSSNGDDYPAGVSCAADRDARNIFQSIKSFSGYDHSSEEIRDKPSSGLQTAPADSLFLIDLGTTLCDQTKEYVENNMAMASDSIKEDVNVEGATMQEENVEEVNFKDSFEEEREEKWCPLTPTSEPERDTLTSTNVPDNAIVINNTDYSQNNSDVETKIGTTLLIKECWSLAGKESFWTNSSDGANDCHKANLSESDQKRSVLVSSNYNVNKNIYMESDLEKQTSPFEAEVTCVEIVQSTGIDEQEAISCALQEESFHREHSVNDGDVKSSHTTCVITDRTVVQTIEHNFSESDAKHSNVPSSKDIQEISDCTNQNMVTPLEENPNFSQVQLSQTRKEQCMQDINTGSPVPRETSLVVAPKQQPDQHALNPDAYSNTEIQANQHLVNPLSNPESGSTTIQQLISKFVDDIVSSEQTCKDTQMSSTSPQTSNVTANTIPEHDAMIAGVSEAQHSMEHTPMSVLTAVSLENKMVNNQTDGQNVETSVPVAGVNVVKNKNESHSVFNTSTSQTPVGKIQEGDTTNKSAPELAVNDDKFGVDRNKPDEFRVSSEIWNELNVTASPSQINERKRGRPRGRPRGRGRGGYRYGNRFIRQEIPFGHHMVHMNNFNNPINRDINNINQTDQNRQQVNVPIELPSKGVIGVVSQNTYSEIQKHLSASKNLVSTKPVQNQPGYQDQPSGHDGGILVPIYDANVLKLVQRTISNSDSGLQTPAHIKSNLQMPPTVQTNGPNPMIELQRPPPAYQPALPSNINAHNYGTYISPIHNNLQLAVNQNEVISRNLIKVENESVLALPRGAITNMPVPISIPKSRYNRKGSNIKGNTLTVREQLLQKIRGRKNYAGITPRFQQSSYVTNAPRLQMLPRPPPPPPCPSSIPHEGISFTPLPHTHSSPNEIRSSQPFPLYRSSPTVSPRISFNHSFVAAPHYRFQTDPQKPVSHMVMPIEPAGVQNDMNSSFASNPTAMFTAPSPQIQTFNTLKLPTSVSAPNNPPVNIIPVAVNNTRTPTNNAAQLRITKEHHLEQQKNVHIHNPVATRKLQELKSPPQQALSALDLSMKSKYVHINGTAPKPKGESAPLDLSRKTFSTVPTSDVKYTPLDLSRKEQTRPAQNPEPVNKNPYLNIHEVTPQQVNMSLETPTFVSDINPEQTLSVLAAAAEMLESRNVNITNGVDPPDQSPTPKMTKIRVKFNSKRKLWHLVPTTKEYQKHGKKSKRGRPQNVRDVKESTRGKLHNCQFCDFSHSLKSEVRVHVKMTHFAKFKKDPKTNNLSQDDTSDLVNMERVNEKPVEDQESRPSNATPAKQGFKCKSCDFKAKASYLLQRHVMKWHPNNTSYMCQLKDCAQTFETMELLHEHHLLHRKNQKHICHICGASYHYINGLRAHVARHHSLLAYPCLHCGLKFKSRGTLQRHRIQKNHLDVEEKTSSSNPGASY